MSGQIPPEAPTRDVPLHPSADKRPHGAPKGRRGWWSSAVRLAGFVATIPMLRRLRRRTGSWRAPALALGDPEEAVDVMALEA